MAAPRRATIDFFAGQAAARRRTALLLVLFAAALALTVALVYAALLLPFGLKLGHLGWWQPRLLAWVSAGVLGVVAVGAVYHRAVLGADGGDAVARRLGGVPVPRPTADPGERRFLDVLEEMAIAAGLPVPRGYVLPAEPGVNAFTAGVSPGRAVVVVTRGALEALDRDELQGVVAHELSHVLHGDVRLNARILAAVGGLGAVAALGQAILRGAWDVPLARRRNASALPTLVGFALACAGWIGHLCGELLRYAVSREREHLADAAAVQFTRLPEGLAGALRKAAERGSLLVAPQAAQVSHFLFANGVAGVLETSFATHPPLEERLRRLVPAGLPARAARRDGEGDAPARAGRTGDAPAGTRGAASAATGAAAGPLLPPQARAPGPAELAAASQLLASLPPPLADAAREPFGARGLACALLLAPARGDARADGGLRARQVARLARADPAAAAEVERLAPLLESVGREARVVLLDLLLPALDLLSRAQAEALREDLAALAAEARGAPVFTWAVHRALSRRLERRLSGAGAAPVRHRTLGAVEVEALEVLSLVAWSGSADAAAAQAALDAAAPHLRLRARWRPLARERLAGGVGRALAALDLASPPIKEALLTACAAAAARDGRITPEEAAVLRAVAASLGCPVPPVVAPPAVAVRAAG